MQFRSGSFDVLFSDVRLPDSFPIVVHPNVAKDDTPIRSLHVHDCLEIGLCHQGSGLLIVGDKALTYNAGDVTFIPGSEVHFSRSAEGTRSRWSWIMLDPIRLLPGLSDIADPSPFCGAGFLNVFAGEAHTAMPELAGKLIAEMDGQDLHWRTAVIGHVMQIMVHVHRTRQKGTVSGPTSYNRLAPALQYIADHCSEKLRISELARLCGMSEPSFRRHFGATFSMSPQTYVQTVRLRMAAALLRGTKRRVLDISLSVGFDSLSSFNRLFHRQYGQNPSSWRRHTRTSEVPVAS